MGRKEDLGFYWKAKFADNSEIAQFDETGEEIAFSEIENYSEELKQFSLVSAAEDKEYIMDLNDMKINTPTRNYVVTGNNPELVYFRRNDVRMEVGPNGTILFPRVVHHVGIKTDTMERKFEVFAGQGMKPKQILYNDNGNISDITDD